MPTRTIGFYQFDEEDVIGKCPHDGGPLVKDLTLANFLDLDEGDSLDLELGIATLAFCPVGSHVVVTRAPLIEVDPDATFPLDP